ncbi:MAG: hypothetical protein R2845_01715 [Thermomicrobiales bacterium]
MTVFQKSSKSEGSECNVRVLDNAEFSLQLDYKLAEELSEYQESKEPEELVDIAESQYEPSLRGMVELGDFERQCLKT